MSSSAEKGADFRSVYTPVGAERYLAPRGQFTQFPHCNGDPVSPNLSGQGGDIAAVILSGSAAAHHVQSDNSDADCAFAVYSEIRTYKAFQDDPGPALEPEKRFVELRKICAGIKKTRGCTMGLGCSVVIDKTAGIRGYSHIKKIGLFLCNASSEHFDQFQDQFSA